MLNSKMVDKKISSVACLHIIIYRCFLFIRFVQPHLVHDVWALSPSHMPGVRVIPVSILPVLQRGVQTCQLTCSPGHRGSSMCHMSGYLLPDKWLDYLEAKPSFGRGNVMMTTGSMTVANIIPYVYI